VRGQRLRPNGHTDANAAPFAVNSFADAVARVDARPERGTA
jgi:hypothetical protein